MNKTKVSDEVIKDILGYSMLTCEQISIICGLSLYGAKNVRLAILKRYQGKFVYSPGAHVRTDHFLIYYESPRFFHLYKEIFGIDLSANNYEINKY